MAADAYLDWGWFLLLGLTVVFLPDSPPLRSEYALEHEPLPAACRRRTARCLARSSCTRRRLASRQRCGARAAASHRVATPAGTTFVGACGRHLVGATLLAFAAWNLSKLPTLAVRPGPPAADDGCQLRRGTLRRRLDDPDRPEECLGEETQANLAAWLDGYRAEKLMADPSLFLAPHIAMGVSLQLLGALALYGVAPPVASARVFFPLSIVFALHILPVAHGIPNSLAGGRPVNQTIVALLLIAAAAGHVGLLMRRTRLRLELSAKVIGRAFVAVCLLTNLAPFFESLLIVHNALFARYHNGGRWPHPTPTADLPHPDRPSVGSGHDLYARMGCPPLGWLVTGAILLVLPYYIAHIALPRARTVVDRDGDGIPDVLGIVGPKATAPPTRNPRPGAWDADGDGEISWGEVQAKLRHRLMCFAGGRSGGPALWQLLRVRVDTRVEEVRGSGPCVVVMCRTLPRGNRRVLHHHVPDVVGAHVVVQPEPLEQPAEARVGYNNICVGFDAPPARYIAMPLQVLQAYFACRYTTLDTARAECQRRSDDAALRISGWQFAFTRLANLCYGGFMVCFPVLLV